MNSLENWIMAWSALGVLLPDPALYEELLARYSEPNRHYHTRQHLGECLRHFYAISVQARKSAGACTGPLVP